MQRFISLSNASRPHTFRSPALRSFSSRPQHGPLSQFESLVDAGRLRSDERQREVAAKLQSLHYSLLDFTPAEDSDFDFFNSKQLFENIKAPKGLYLYGGVGCGKSMLMDLFFANAPIQKKRRVHFHQFMLDVHQRMHMLRQERDSQSPPKPEPIERPAPGTPISARARLLKPRLLLKGTGLGKESLIRPVAASLVQEARLLCFDEFQVTDIVDAMLLKGLFSAMFEMGVVVVATSNVPPIDLYKNGLQRQLFEPFIDVLQSRCDVHNLASPIDYRSQALDAAKLKSSASSSTNPLPSWISSDLASELNGLDAYVLLPTASLLSPEQATTLPELRTTAEKRFEDLFTEDAKFEAQLEKLGTYQDAMNDLKPKVIEVAMGRHLNAKRTIGGIARFDFDELCAEALGAADYQALARNFHTIYIEKIPQLKGNLRDQARRFITLVDEMYEAKLKIVLSAETTPQRLFAGEYSVFDMERQELAEDLHLSLPSAAKLPSPISATSNPNAGYGNAGDMADWMGEEMGDLRPNAHLLYPNYPPELPAQSSQKMKEKQQQQQRESPYEAMRDREVALKKLQSDSVLSGSGGNGPDPNLHDPDFSLPSSDMATREDVVAAARGERPGFEVRVVREGGASGRHMTVIKSPSGEVFEWSATGLEKASLINLFTGEDEVFASKRCVSRISEMQTADYLLQHRQRVSKAVVPFSYSL